MFKKPIINQKNVRVMKKLSLKKDVIERLSNPEAMNLKGGTATIFVGCGEETVVTCQANCDTQDNCNTIGENCPTNYAC